MSQSTNSVAAPSEAPLKGQRKRINPLFVVILFVLGAIGYFVWLQLNPPVDPHKLLVSGRLEGYETNLGPKIGGLVEYIAAREGDRVKAGQIVAQLADADYQAQLRGALARIQRAEHQLLQREGQLPLLEAQTSGAQRRLAQAREETIAQVEQACANLREAEAKMKQARSELAESCSQLDLSSIRLVRYTELVKKGAVAKDEYDQARTTYNNSLAQVTAREAAVQASEKAVQAARAAVKQQQTTRFTPPIRVTDINVISAQRQQALQDIEAARQEVASAIAERDQIIANINYLTISSPIDGVITARPVEPGAVLVPGQTVLTVLDYAKVYMRGYVPEGEIGRVKIGQKAQVYLDALPNRPFSGYVSEIDPEAAFTPENIYFKNDRVKQVFGIKVTLNKPDGLAKPGMPADAELRI